MLLGAAAAGDGEAGPREGGETRARGSRETGSGRRDGGEAGSGAAAAAAHESSEPAEGAGDQAEGDENDAVGRGRRSEFHQPMLNRVVAVVFAEQEEGGEAVVVGVGVFGDLFEGGEVDRFEVGGVAEVVVGRWVGGGASFVEPAEDFVVGGHGAMVCGRVF